MAFFRDAERTKFRSTRETALQWAMRHHLGCHAPIQRATRILEHVETTQIMIRTDAATRNSLHILWEVTDMCTHQRSDFHTAQAEQGLEWVPKHGTGKQVNTGVLYTVHIGSKARSARAVRPYSCSHAADACRSDKNRTDAAISCTACSCSTTCHCNVLT